MYEQDIKKLLDGVHDLLQNESHWCKKGSSKRANGIPCSPFNAGAVQWDMYGALMKVAKDLGISSLVIPFARKQISSMIPSSSHLRDIEYYNDKITHDQMLALLAYDPNKK